MKWMQFFTPVGSMDFKEAKAYISKQSAKDITILDVRQPSEYEKTHIPGAVLVPLPQLSDRMGELDPEKPALVYCAVGGRSRVAVQMLAGNGFKKVFNLSGGIKAWESEIAVGPQDLGLDLFSGKEAPEEVLKVAYSLEQGLRDFYLAMGKEASNERVKDLFARLADIEVKHQMSIYLAYNDIHGTNVDKDEFEKMVEKKSLEGGLSTEEYLQLFNPDLNSEIDVVSLAMSIEAQALDLYLRVSERISHPESKQIVLKIAGEEKMHLESLGRLMDNF